MYSINLIMMLRYIVTHKYHFDEGMLYDTMNIIIAFWF